MIGDPQSIKAFKTLITPENVKFFWDSDSDRICSDPYHFAFIRIRNFAQVFSCQFSCDCRRGNTSENLSSRHFKYLFTTICAELLSSLNLLMSPLVIAICSQGGFFVPTKGPREVCRLDYVTEWYVPKKAPMSELDDVANEVFAAAEDDTSVQLALQNCLSESEHHVLTQEEVEEEAVLWANLKRNFYTNFLLKLLTDAVMVLWESSEGFFVPAILSEVCKPRICDRLICADYIPEAAPDPDIVVSKGSVSNDNTGGEGSGLGDVGNEVFAYDDVA